MKPALLLLLPALLLTSCAGASVSPHSLTIKPIKGFSLKIKL